jgi:hypothetical protein
VPRPYPCIPRLDQLATPFWGGIARVKVYELVSAGSVLLLDLMLGLALLATIGLAATRSRLAAQAPDRWLGSLLIAVPLPLVVASRLAVPSSPVGGQTAFVCGVLAFAVGAVLVMSSRDDKDDSGEPDGGPEPWWPDFEREFRAYARRQSRPRIRV